MFIAFRKNSGPGYGRSWKLLPPRRDDLTRMPLPAIATHAAWCTRRGQPLFRLVTDIADFARREAAVERAISLAERFCVGDESESRTIWGRNGVAGMSARTPGPVVPP
jgi:hypothetical protein